MQRDATDMFQWSRLKRRILDTSAQRVRIIGCAHKFSCTIGGQSLQGSNQCRSLGSSEYSCNLTFRMGVLNSIEYLKLWQIGICMWSLGKFEFTWFWRQKSPGNVNLRLRCVSTAHPDVRKTYSRRYPRTSQPRSGSTNEVRSILENVDRFVSKEIPY